MAIHVCAEGKAGGADRVRGGGRGGRGIIPDEESGTTCGGTRIAGRVGSSQGACSAGGWGGGVVMRSRMLHWWRISGWDK